MSEIDMMVTVSKETYELGEALANMVGSVKSAMSDGWQPGQDIPAVMTAFIANIGQAVEGLRAAQGELKANPEAFAAAVSLGLVAVVREVTK